MCLIFICVCYIVLWRKHLHTLDATIKRTLRTCNIQPTEQELEQDSVYIKVPFINEDLKQQTKAVIKRSGIQNIKVHYITGRPLSRNNKSIPRPVRPAYQQRR